jgi:hypothetical protein
MDGQSFTEVVGPIAMQSPYGAPWCAAVGTEVWVASGVATESDPTNASSLALLHSADAGSSFDAASVVAMQTSDAPDPFEHPAIAARAGGQLEVLFYRGTEGGPASVVRATTSQGGGWELADVAKLPTISRQGGTSGVGDYLGLTAAADGSYAVFGDNSSGRTHIRFSRRNVEGP